MKSTAQQATQIDADQAFDVLGLDSSLWTIQFTDEELRMLQEIMEAESRRREAIFGGLHEKVASFGE